MSSEAKQSQGGFVSRNKIEFDRTGFDREHACGMRNIEQTTYDVELFLDPCQYQTPYILPLVQRFSVLVHVTSGYAYTDLNRSIHDLLKLTYGKLPITLLTRKAMIRKV